MKEILPHLFTLLTITILYLAFGFKIALIIMIAMIFGSLLLAYIWDLIINYKNKRNNL